MVALTLCRHLVVLDRRWTCLKQIAGYSQAWTEAQWSYFDCQIAADQLESVTADVLAVSGEMDSQVCFMRSAATSGKPSSQYIALLPLHEKSPHHCAVTCNYAIAICRTPRAFVTLAHWP